MEHGETTENTGIVLSYEKDAMHGYELPDGLQLHDQLMYMALRSLYRQHRAGILSRDQAVREKKKLLESYRQLKFRVDLANQHFRVLKAVEENTSRYAKDRTLENADKMYADFYGVTPKGRETA